MRPGSVIDVLTSGVLSRLGDGRIRRRTRGLRARQRKGAISARTDSHRTGPQAKTRACGYLGQARLQKPPVCHVGAVDINACLLDHESVQFPE